MDDIVVFNPLNKNNLIEIVGIMFKKLSKTLQNRGISAVLTQNAEKFIASAGFDIQYGARPLRRALYDLVEDKIADMILSDEIKSGDNIKIDSNDEKIEISVEK